MPKARKPKSTKAGSKSAEAAAAVSNAEHAIEEAALKAKDIVEDVVEAAEEFTDRMSGIERASVSEAQMAAETPGDPIEELPESNQMAGIEEGAAPAIQTPAEVAEAETPGEHQKILTMEERKAKMALLQQKLVRQSPLFSLF